MNLSYRPLPPVWPSGQRTPYYERRRSPFKASYANTMTLLEHELRQLGVDSYDAIVVEAGYSEREIRLDGKPRADAKLSDPAVILSFKSKHGHLRYGCDTFTDHLANLRAIGLALQALRAVDRYGVTKRGEQYVGWKSLSASGESQSAVEARAFLRRFAPAGVDASNFELLYRAAAKKLHPDVGGSREEWAQLQRAKEALNL